MVLEETPKELASIAILVINMYFSIFRNTNVNGI
jgi:hypothetical protein